MTLTICGVDVSSTHLDASIGRNGAKLQVERTPEGIGQLAAFCREQGVELVAMEATGGYERLPFLLLWQQGVACALVNPRALRRFAEGMGVLEKTDAIDAGMIAWFAAVKRLVPQEPPSQAQQKLAALVRRLGQLTALKVSQTNQRRLAEDPEVLASCQALLATITRQIREIEARIAQLIEADPFWRQLDACLRSIKGVAGRTVARLMADLPEIGTLSGKAVTKLAGLAPLAKDSGKLKGRRRIRGGRASIRSILYVVADLVRRHNPHFADFHRRLSKEAKAKKAIRIAIARKLLVQLNAKARDLRRQLLPQA